MYCFLSVENVLWLKSENEDRKLKQFSLLGLLSTFLLVMKHWKLEPLICLCVPCILQCKDVKL